MELDGNNDYPREVKGDRTPVAYKLHTFGVDQTTSILDFAALKL